jgi:hypothetical protein
MSHLNRFKIGLESGDFVEDLEIFHSFFRQIFPILQPFLAVKLLKK